MWLKSRQLYRVLATRPRVASAATSSPLVKSHRTTVTSQSVAAADQPPDAHPHPTPLQTASPLEEKCVSDSQLATIPEHLKLFNLIKAYESEGHLIANLDPLQNAQLDPRRAPFVLEQVDILRKEYYGFKESDLTKQFHIGTQLPTLGPICTLKQVLRKLRQAYCGSVGIEFTHIIDKERRLWISHQVWQMCTRQDLYNRHTIARLRRIAKEGRCPPPASSLLTASGGLAPASRTESGLDQALAGEAQPPNQHEQVLGSVGVTDEVDRASRAEQLQTLELLAHTVRFETFCSERFSGAKRFGVEGCETLIPGLKAALDRAAHNGVQCVEMGMAHRGR
jgi:2-oxoglutarate dehydrogenase complex dehydrogenase (E1) component-like enzyme